MSHLVVMTVILLSLFTSPSFAHWGLEYLQSASDVQSTYTAEERLLILRALFLGTKKVQLGSLIQQQTTTHRANEVVITLSGGRGSYWFYETLDGKPSHTDEGNERRSSIIDRLIIASILTTTETFGEHTWNEAGAQQLLQELDKISIDLGTTQWREAIWSDVLVGELVGIYLNSNSPIAFQLLHEGQQALWKKELKHGTREFWAKTIDPRDWERSKIIRLSFFEPDRMKMMNIALSTLAIKLQTGLRPSAPIHKANSVANANQIVEAAKLLIPYLNMIRSTPEFVVASLKVSTPRFQVPLLLYQMAETVSPLMDKFVEEALKSNKDLPKHDFIQQAKKLHDLSLEIRTAIHQYADKLPFSRCDQVL